jgi:hypothetical protein
VTRKILPSRLLCCLQVGWEHWVTNLQPCVKLAFEILRPSDAAGVLQMQRHLLCLCPSLGDDYMQPVQHVVEELLGWSHVLNRV